MLAFVAVLFAASGGRGDGGGGAGHAYHEFRAGMACVILLWRRCLGRLLSRAAPDPIPWRRALQAGTLHQRAAVPTAISLLRWSASCSTRLPEQRYDAVTRCAAIRCASVREPVKDCSASLRAPCRPEYSCGPPASCEPSPRMTSPAGRMGTNLALKSAPQVLPSTVCLSFMVYGEGSWHGFP